MIRKPLYLEGGTIQVGLDGPALKVSRDESADRWFPLRRLDRVVSARHVDWRLEALLACMENGISVHFVDTDGTTIAHCFGRGKVSRNGISIYLMRFLERPEWASRYDDWRRAMEQLAVRSVLRRCGAAQGPGMSAKALRQWFFEDARERGKLGDYRHFGAVTRSALASLVAQQWLDAGVDLAAMRAHGLNLVEDCTDLLFLDFEITRSCWLATAAGKTPGRDGLATLGIVQLFEQRRRRVDRLLERVVSRFHAWLIEVLQDGE